MRAQGKRGSELNWLEKIVGVLGFEVLITAIVQLFLLIGGTTQEPSKNDVRDTYQETQATDDTELKNFQQQTKQDERTTATSTTDTEFTGSYDTLPIEYKILLISTQGVMHDANGKATPANSLGQGLLTPVKIKYNIYKNQAHSYQKVFIKYVYSDGLEFTEAQPLEVDEVNVSNLEQRTTVSKASLYDNYIKNKDLYLSLIHI